MKVHRGQDDAQLAIDRVRVAVSWKLTEEINKTIGVLLKEAKRSSSPAICINDNIYEHMRGCADILSTRVQ